jgi:hypothetical protein
MSITTPGTKNVAGMPCRRRRSKMRGTATRPNSPREIGVGVVNPRAMKPVIASKSKVRQTMWRITAPPPVGACHLSTGLPRHRSHSPVDDWYHVHRNRSSSYRRIDALQDRRAAASKT